MRRYIKTSCITVLALGILAAGQTLAEEERTEPVSINMMTSPSTAGPYQAFASINTHIESFSDWLRLDVKETQGATYHVKYMLRNPQAYDNTIFSSGTVVEWAAQEGLKPYFSQPFEEIKDFKVVAVYGETYNVWVTTKDGVKTPNDFVGLHVGNGLLSQNEWGMHQRILLDAWGLLPKLGSFEILGARANVMALLDGRTSVATLFGLRSADGKNTVVAGPHRELAAANRSWHYVNVPGDMIQSYVEETGAPFRTVSLPKGSLPKLDTDITTFGDLLTMSAHKSVPNDVVYEFVRMLVENYEKISEYTAFAKAWTPETLALTADTNPDRFHPGALQAYKDLGIIE